MSSREASRHVPNFGVGVFNRIDEPLGPQQRINRARTEGANINTYGRKVGNVPSFSAQVQAAGAYVPNFEAQQKQMKTAIDAFDSVAKSVQQVNENWAKGTGTDGIEGRVEEIAKVEPTHSEKANINVTVGGTVNAMPNAIAQAVIDWSKRKMINGGGYFPPHRQS